MYARIPAEVCCRAARLALRPPAERRLALAVIPVSRGTRHAWRLSDNLISVQCVPDAQSAHFLQRHLFYQKRQGRHTWMSIVCL
jgi:hypothetical protein